MNLAPEIRYFGPYFPRCQPGNGGHELYRLLEPDEIRYTIEQHKALGAEIPCGATIGMRQWRHLLRVMGIYHMVDAGARAVDISGLQVHVRPEIADYFEWRY